ncbi:relaxase/mobilization nuclease domain-containing protein [uncultured Roseobacter sp.]|uniref:relaxase/mobilization nuclease domain-containing protein n=1 Tax=uncultured Roseobacter sp. TaxID=114847 RepID=UPI0026042490|nr:relaxase/mobilization nuclease domain-containing protein [uncultured Roseobacter sp.]
MILKGSQRSGGLKLAAHLMNSRDNDHVEVHELRGFTAETLHGAFQEADAISKGTKCQQYLFSLSINPPETERVSTADILDAVERAEQQLGLNDQARAIVFHEKNGRRHAHVVWSRIDAMEMKAVCLPFYKQRLKGLSKELFLEHGWRLPDGFRDKQNRDPRNFSLSEWQQAKRIGKDARQIKMVFQEAWQVSDNRAAFAAALEEKGFFLAKGDRRGFVALDVHGEVYAVAKWTGQRTRQVKEKLGIPKELRSVGETKAHIAKSMQPALDQSQTELKARKQKLKQRQDQERGKLIERQRAERQRLKERLEQRQIAEVKQRQERFRVGLKGLWDRLRGEHSKIKKENEAQAWTAHLRDHEQTDQLVFQHLDERKNLGRQQRHEMDAIKEQAQALAMDREKFRDVRGKSSDRTRDRPIFER